MADDYQPPVLLPELERRANALPYLKDPAIPAHELPVQCGARCPGCPRCGRVHPDYRDYWQGLVDQALETCKRSPTPVETLLTIPPGTAFSRAIVGPLQAWREATYDPARDGGPPEDEA